MIFPEQSLHYDLKTYNDLLLKQQTQLSVEMQQARINSILNANLNTCQPYIHNYTLELYGGWNTAPIAYIDTNVPENTNCINCGASLKGKHLCEYCDTYNR